MLAGLTWDNNFFDIFSQPNFQSAGIVVCNFHQLCLKILRENYQLIGFQHQVCFSFQIYSFSHCQFQVLGAHEQKNLINECYIRWKKYKSAASGENVRNQSLSSKFLI